MVKCSEKHTASELYFLGADRAGSWVGLVNIFIPVTFLKILPSFSLSLIHIAMFAPSCQIVYFNL